MNDRSPEREFRDEAIRRVYERNAPAFAAGDIWDEVAAAIPDGRRARGCRKRFTRVAIIACAACAIIAGISVGVLQLTQPSVRPIQFEVAGDQGTTPTSGDDHNVYYGGQGFFVVGRADQIRLATAWQQIADAMGVDAKMTSSSNFMLEFSPEGVLVALSVHVEPSPGIQWDAVWDGRAPDGGTAVPGREVLVSVDKTAKDEGTAEGSLTGGLCPGDVLPKVDEVGIEHILEMFPLDPGCYLRVGWWDVEDDGAFDDPAYVWTGAGFEPLNILEQEHSSASLVGLQVAVVTSGSVAGQPTRFYFPYEQESAQGVTPIPLEDVAFVELERDEQGPMHQDGYTGGRRILSPVADADGVQAVLLDAAAAAWKHGSALGVTPGNGESAVTEITVIIHLRDGTAQTHSSSSPLGVAGQMLAAPFTGQGAALLPAVMPDDFGFVAAFGLYGKSVLDTFAGEFHQDMIQPPGSTATAELQLTHAQLEAAYAAFRQMDILAYATDFNPQPGLYVTPHDSYYLRVRVGGVEKEIRWNDETLSTSPQATALRDWFSGLQDLVRETPGFKALPEPRGGYD